MTNAGHAQPGLISVVIPTYDRSDRMLGAAIDSVLGQDVPSLELIIVDDGSTEPAAPLAHSYGQQLVVHRQTNGGIGSARNAGIALARGEFLAFLDSDDVWMPNKLTTQLAALSEDPELDAVFGQAQQFHDEELSAAERARHPIKDEVVDAYLSSAMLIRRVAFDRVGAFTDTQQNGVDIDWFLRSREAELRTLMLPKIVFRRRLHTSNTSLTNPNANRDRLLSLKRGLDRRRAAKRAAEEGEQ